MDIKTPVFFLLLVCCFLIGMPASVIGAQIPGSERFNTVHYLSSDFPEMNITAEYNLDIQIFCRLADKQSPMYFFRSATLRIISGAEDIKLIKGTTPDEVYKQYKTSTWLFWIANLMPWRMRDASFPTFNSSCVGISTDQPYTAKLILRYADPWKVVIFCCGLILFFMSERLAKSTMFFYSSATFVGALGAALLLIFVVSRFLPRGRGSYMTMAMLYSMLVYFVGETWNRFEELVQQRLPYIILYLSLGAIISLITSYRFGPPTNIKTLNIIKWALQIFGLGFIHLSSDLIEVSTCVIIGLIMYRCFSHKMLTQVKRLKFRMFPPKRKLLSEEEYINQGAIETEKELEKLREFCNSPECKPWKVVSKLKDPKRFSSFMEGSSHLEDDEILAYDSENEALEEAAAADLLTDDEEGNVTDDD